MAPATHRSDASGARRAALRGQLPPRYDGEFWRRSFDDAVDAVLQPGQRVLDLGSGAMPAVPPERRPEGITYVGLDISASELAKAPPGSYDEVHVSDAVIRRPELAGSFDVVLSYQVFEHLRPLAAAIENLRGYLVDGGVLVSQFSGTFSLFGLVNRAVPQPLALWGLRRFLGRDPTTVFPAYYDQCWNSALVRLFAPWSSAEILPLYTGAGYLEFVKPIQALYVGLEEAWVRRDARNLAAYYVVTARR
ncbi:MAG TPA: class I SAM-dependent methyltransferase [Capillimicrobium sp.]